jgi:hypothetical protein
MNRAQKILICAWLMCLSIIGAALFSTPYFRSAPIFGVNGQDGLFESFFAFAIAAIPCSWPWYFALRWSAIPDGDVRQILFGIISVLTAAIFFAPIAFGHDFSIGLNMIFYVFIMWVAYPFVSPPKR